MDERNWEVTKPVGHAPFHFTSTMVLADLGRKLNAALSSLNRASVVDEKVIAIPWISDFDILTLSCRRYSMPH